MQIVAVVVGDVNVVDAKIREQQKCRKLFVIKRYALKKMYYSLNRTDTSDHLG